MVTSKLEKITPAKARQYLESNTNNRRLREKYINELVQAMRSGEWVSNGESIKFDEEGNLADGQHRLNAIVIANVPVEILVVRGVPKTAFDTIDRGSVRTIGDVLYRHGCQYASAVAAATVLMDQYSAGNIGGSDGGSTVRLTPTRALEITRKHPDLAASAAAAYPSMKILRPGIGTFTHYLFSRVHPRKAEEFFARLADGEGLRKTQAVYKLRERLLADKSSKAKLRRGDIVALCMKAWKHATNGDTVSTLRVGPDESLVVKGMEPEKV